MKRATGLVLAILAFAVLTHADRMTYGGSEYAIGAGGDCRSETASTEALHGSNLRMGPGNMEFGAGRAFFGSGDTERVSDLVLYSRFGASERAVERRIETDSMRLRWESIWGDRYEGLGEFLRIDHPDPFRRELGVQDVSEPGTLLLMGAGLMALALWKRRAITPEHPFVRFF
jgi:hypothetical protein